MPSSIIFMLMMAITVCDGQLDATSVRPANLRSIPADAGISRRLLQVNNREVLAWGSSNDGLTPLPAEVLDGASIAAVSAGGYHSLALTRTGKVIAWGLNGDGQCTVSTQALSNIVAISAGSYHSLALTNTGRVIAWGDNTELQTSIPTEVLASNITAISAGGAHSLALSSSGRVYAWGMNTYGPGGPISNQIDVPMEALSNIASVSAGGYHSLALTKTGRVIAWGGNLRNQTSVPTEALNNVVMISAGGEHNMVVVADQNIRKLLVWGRNDENQTAPVSPAVTGDIAAICASYFVSVVLTSSGRVIVWGANSYNQSTVPTDALQGVTSVSAWGEHLLAIAGPAPQLPATAFAPPTTSTSSPAAALAATDSSSSVNVPLVVGLTVGLGGAALLAIIATIVILQKKRKHQPPDAESANAAKSLESGTVFDKAVVLPSESASRTQSHSDGPVSLVGSTAAVEINVRAVFLELAQQTCNAKPPAGLLNNEAVTNASPLVDGLTLDVDISKDIALKQVIGEGGCATVHTGVYKETDVAVKVVPATDNMYVQELGILGRMRHPNIVSLLGAGVKGKQVYLILELADSSLDKLLYSKTLPFEVASEAPEPSSPPVLGRLLPLPMVLHIAIEMARGLAYLHPTIMHRDLKPANVLINKPDVIEGLPGVKLSDFGLARMMASVTLQTGNPAAGTIAYMAPECFNKEQEGLTCKCDIYSFGMCLWELLHGRTPWQNEDPGLLLFAVVIQSKRPAFTASTERCPPELKTLIKRCWDADVKQRPTATDVVVQLVNIANRMKKQ